MSKMLAALSLIALLTGPAAALTDQQAKMKECNTQATQQSLTGDARKTFMSSCLKAGGGNGGTQLTSQQQRMKDCNASATSQSLKGEPRKEFMSSCLKK